MRRILTGLGAIALLTLLLVGLPILLIAIGPVGLPHVEPTFAGIWAALLRPDDGTLFLTLIKAAGWAVWVLLTIAVLIELVAAARRLSAPNLRGLAVPQGLARALIAAAVALFLNTNTTLTSPAPASAHPAPAGAPAAPGQPHPAPADAAKAAPAFERYTVKKGDILSQLALDHLGDARRYPEIYKASRNIDQPGGRRLTDPDVIDIGWKLNIPTHAEKPDKPDKTPQPEPAQPKPAATPPTAPTPLTAPTPGPTTPTAPATHAPPSAAPVDLADTDAPPAWLLGGLAGGGAVLAGALWLLLLRRRAIQHHHRRPGYVTAPPPRHTLPVEKTLRRHGQPVADLLILIDEALRRLALTLIDTHQPLPEIGRAHV